MDSDKIFTTEEIAFTAEDFGKLPFLEYREMAGKAFAEAMAQSMADHVDAMILRSFVLANGNWKRAEKLSKEMPWVGFEDWKPREKNL